MEKINKSKVWKFIFQIFAVAVAAGVAGIAFVNFFEDLNIIPTGMSGLALLIKSWIGGKLSTSIIYLILNLILFACAWKFFGWKYLVLSGVGLGSYVLAMEFGKISLLAGDPVSEKLLYAVVGSIIAGLCIGVAMRMGGSTGGSDILGTLVNRMIPKVKTGHVLLGFNILVLVLSVITTGELSTGLYALISAIVSTAMTNMVLDGSKKIKAFYIICDKPDKVSQAIMTHYHRGVTKLNGEGMYTHNEKAVLLCLVPYDQAYKMREFITKIDENAFVFSSPVTETIGENLLMEGKKKKEKAPLKTEEQKEIQQEEKTTIETDTTEQVVETEPPQTKKIGRPKKSTTTKDEQKTED